MTNFKIKKNQTDYTDIHWAPVINCVLFFEGTILILQRSNELNFYPGHWNGVSGFLDDKKSLNEKVKNEILEEVGIGEENIEKIELGKIFHQSAPKYKKTWIVHPILVRVKSNEIKLNWEAKNHQWIKIEDVNKYKLLPGFEGVIDEMKKIL